MSSNNVGCQSASEQTNASLFFPYNALSFTTPLLFQTTVLPIVTASKIGAVSSKCAGINIERVGLLYSSVSTANNYDVYIYLHCVSKTIPDNRSNLKKDYRMIGGPQQPWP